MNVIDALQWRYAVKQFSSKTVSATQLQQLLDATRLSASAFGLQPYKILAIESESVRKKLLPFSFGQEKVLHSSHLIVLTVNTTIDDQLIDRYLTKHSQATGQALDTLKNLEDHLKSVFNDMTADKKREWAHQQAFIALGNFLTSAALMQIDCCPMTGFDQAGYDNVLALSDKGLTSSWICPIGYRDSQDQRATAPKVRFSHQEMVLEI